MLWSLSADGMGDHIAKKAKDYLYPWLCFRNENYIAHLDTSFEKFDVILCLGTIKWVHLNFGDLGVKALFHKAYESLDPGGLFLLGAQNWKSYKKKKNLSKDISDVYKTISFRPNQFESYLTKSVGFSRVDILVNEEVEEIYDEKFPDWEPKKKVTKK